MNCPIIEQTADGVPCGRCYCFLNVGPNGWICPRHSDVEDEGRRFQQTGHTTLENVMRKRKGMPLLGRATE